MMRAIATSGAAQADRSPSKQLGENGDTVEPGQDSDWPRIDVTELHLHNDVLYGRGAGTTYHPGNIRFRELVTSRKMAYITAKRTQKRNVAMEVVNAWRDQSPPGRFLKYDEVKSLYVDVGDTEARIKTAQALREDAPLLRTILTGNQGTGKVQVSSFLFVSCIRSTLLCNFTHASQPRRLIYYVYI